MGVTVHEDDFVRSGECIDCMRCMAVCRPQALRTVPAPAVAGTASALALCGLIQVGKLAVPEQPAASTASLAGEYASEQVVSAETGSPATRYADGMYTGSGNGFRGVISAQVTVEGGRITDVTILSSSDDRDFFQRAQNGVIPAILQAQSVNVSAVSGATYSSRGILEEVADALQLDASALPEITVPQGHSRNNRPGMEDRDQNDYDMTPPSGAPGSDQRQRQGRQEGQDQDESSGQRQRRQRKSGKNRG